MSIDEEDESNKNHKKRVYTNLKIPFSLRLELLFYEFFFDAVVWLNDQNEKEPTQIDVIGFINEWIQKKNITE
jgi:hypothetical protein